MSQNKNNFTDVNEQPYFNSFVMEIEGQKYAIPGIVDVGVECKRQIEKKTADNMDGEEVIDKGSLAVTCVVQSLMNGAEYKNFVEDVLPALKVRASKGSEKPTIIISHPELLAVGVTQILYESHSSPPAKSGSKTVTINFVEKTKPKKQNPPRPTFTAQRPGNITKPLPDSTNVTTSDYGNAQTATQILSYGTSADPDIPYNPNANPYTNQSTQG